MANVRKVCLTGVQKYNGSGWVNLKAKLSEALVDLGTVDVILYDNAIGLTDPTAYAAEVNWNNLTISTGTGYSVFGTDAQQILSTAKSPLIRYKVKTVVYTTEEVEVINQNYYHMMINAGFATDPFAGNGGTASVSSSSAVVAVKFYFPALTSTVSDATALAAQTALLQTANKWLVSCVKGGRSITAVPTSVSIGSPVTTGASDYGIAKVLVTLTCSLTFPSSGTYVVDVSFTSNDSDPSFDIPASYNVVATIAVNTGTPENTYIVSSDGDIAFTINFSTTS